MTKTINYTTVRKKAKGVRMIHQNLLKQHQLYLQSTDLQSLQVLFSFCQAARASLDRLRMQLLLCGSRARHLLSDDRV